MIPFGDWRPDLEALKTADVLNVIPSEDGFRSLPSMQVQSNAISYYCRGAWAGKGKDGTARVYAGDGKNLYAMTNNTWAEVSNGGDEAYTLGTDESWEFAKWGEKIIAVGGANATDPVPQIATFGSDFGDLSGSPPRARHLAIVRNFVVLGNLYESATAYPARLRWSGHNDETTWTSNPATQADFQDLQGSGGWIQRIVGGEQGLIIQERSIWTMAYKGPPEIFTLDEIPGFGTPAPNSVIQRGELVYFYGLDGFYVTAAGQQPQPIGRHILDRYVQDDFDLNEYQRMVGGEDKTNKLLWWIYPGQGHTDGLPNKAVAFDYKTGRWGYAEIEAEWIYDSLGTSTSLDALPAAGYSDLDAMTISLDSDIWKGGAITFGVFDSAHKQNTFSGTGMSAELTTPEVALMGTRRAKVNRLRPIVDGASATIKIGTRNDLEDSVTWGSSLSERSGGSIPCRTNARYQRFKVETTGDFEKAIGVDEGTVMDGGAR